MSARDFLGSKKAFTLIELLVVIAIIAILSVVVILTLNPAELLRQSRDTNRISDMSTLSSALSIYSTDQSALGTFTLGSSSVIYVSIPDAAATTTLGTNCSSLSLPALPPTYTYHCAASSTFRNTDGTGWIPVNFKNISSGSPLGNLAIDPSNQSSSHLFYTYTTNGTQFELTAPIESAKYKLGGLSDIISSDGAPLSTIYAKGTNLALEPLDYGDTSLVGFWPLNEGTGTSAYDFSGNNDTGIWNGTSTGSSGYYSQNGKIASYAGIFDGGSDYINLGTSSILSPTSAQTILAWFQASSTTGGGVILGLTGTHNTFAVSTNAQQIGGYWTTSGTPGGFNYFSSSTTNWNVNGWNLVAITYSSASGNALFYVNGVLAGTYSYGGTITVNNANTITIGARGGGNPGQLNGATYLQGSINNLRVYNRALSTTEIAAMYNGGK